ncbi:MAG: DUF5060 domain-containing protein [Pirellulales bacterium]
MVSRHTYLVALFLCLGISMSVGAGQVEQWGVFELELQGPSSGNPFVDVDLKATFQQEKRSITLLGFYDGEGKYRVRFSPPTQGVWTYVTQSNRKELHQSGAFTAEPPSSANHGPVHVHQQFHFQYADGTRYLPFGTTCYAWIHQPLALQEKTLQTLSESPFNKIRMCLFPKNYEYNKNEPPFYPFEGKPPKDWNVTRFSLPYFRHVESQILALQKLGIEADLILFHPYDQGRWGFDTMSQEADDRYLRYVLARLGAYRNVWWSLANEFDFMKEKTLDDWDRYLGIVQDCDGHERLCSIHNGKEIYNQTKKGLTHASIQNGSAVADFGRAILYRDVYRKPIVFDEAKYEGNIVQRWGNLSAEEMVHRFWQGAIAGTYVGHGETYQHPENIIWWSNGGTLHGQSPARIAFLRQILEKAPFPLEPIDKWQDVQTVGKKGEYYLIYFGKDESGVWIPKLPRDGIDTPLTLHGEWIDTWNMSHEKIDGTFEFQPEGKYIYRCKNRSELPKPAKPYMALLLKK